MDLTMQTDEWSNISGPLVNGYKVDGSKGHVALNQLLGGLQETLNGNDLQITTNPCSVNPNMNRILIWRGFWKIRALMEIYSYKEKTCCARIGVWFYTTIKAPIPSLIKVCKIQPSSGTLELWQSSNLTFRGYLIGTTPMLFVRFSLFVVQALFQAWRHCVAH